MQGWLALEDGTVVHGRPFGAVGTVEGELVFNTSMTGYQEALTDPSYAGQLLMFTFPQIGNYGCHPDWMESSGAQVRACLVREWCRAPHQGQQTLDEWLQAENVPGLEGIDTRTLTIRTREAGTLRAVMCNDGSLEPETGVARAATMEWPSDSNLVAQVSTPKKYRRGRKGPRITLFDWGVKQSIISNLARNCCVTVVPWNTDLAGLEKTKPDLVFMSNGPGDPAHPEMMSVVETVKQALDRWPVVGICLGHQILGLALGGSTYKLRFGHRGANQPVHDTDADRVFITSQNHGYALSEMPEGIAEVFTNLNDHTCEGIRGPGCWSVQFHPEASPGPLDANVLFDRVREMVDG